LFEDATTDWQADPTETRVEEKPCSHKSGTKTSNKPIANFQPQVVVKEAGRLKRTTRSTTPLNDPRTGQKAEKAEKPRL